MKNYRLALIIDDDDDVCLMLKSILTGTFEDIQYTHTLQTGRELLTRMEPDVVFLDNNLPDGQGTSIIKKIKNALHPPIVILITAMDDSRKEAIECGADIFLEKPLTYASIFRALDATGKEFYTK